MEKAPSAGDRVLDFDKNTSDRLAQVQELTMDLINPFELPDQEPLKAFGLVSNIRGAYDLSGQLNPSSVYASDLWQSIEEVAELAGSPNPTMVCAPSRIVNL
jgi:hypothetical protein